MKYHKIKGIEKNVCTCEQKIAYNLAFSWRDIMKKDYENAPCGIQKAETVRAYVRKLTALFSEQYGTKYDIDAIFCALGAGLENYLILPGAGILTSYEVIGEAFPAYYL